MVNWSYSNMEKIHYYLGRMLGDWYRNWYCWTHDGYWLWGVVGFINKALKNGDINPDKFEPDPFDEWLKK